MIADVIESNENSEACLLTKDSAQGLREKIANFEKVLTQVPGVFLGDNESCPLTHKFADGIYVREIFIPKGTLLTGKIHRHSHPNFLMKGDVTVVTEGGGIERLKAPQSMISPAGTKRVVYANEDTVWVTVHVTNSQDLDEIEKEVIVPTYEQLEKEKQLCHGLRQESLLEA